MGLPAFDFGPFVVFLLGVGAVVGAVGLALFLYAPLSWSFYAGVIVGLALFGCGLYFNWWLNS